MSDTPLTDKATFTLDNGMSGVLSVVNSEDMEALERQHNALIAKLEALAKEWEEAETYGNGEYYSGYDCAMDSCANALKSFIQKAKQ